MRTILIALLVSMTSCGRQNPPAARYIAPEQRPVPSAGRVDSLIARFGDLEGRFSDPDSDLYYVLLADHGAIGEIVSADTVAIPKLIACLRDQRRSRVTLRGKQVPIGMLCAYTLLDTPYVQEGLRDDEHGFPEGWAGIVSPTTDPSVLAQAHSAWQDWLAHHALTWAQ